MISGLLRRVTSVGMWGGVCGVFSFFVASGNLAVGVAMLCLLLVYLILLTGPPFIASLWLIGSPTVFNFGNQFLKALPFITLERLLFVLLAVAIFLRAAFVKTKSPGFSRLEVLILLFLGYVLVNMIVSTTADTWRRDLWFFMQYAMPMLMFLLSRRIVWSERGIKALLVALTLTGVAVAGMGILQGLFGVSFFTQDYQTVTHGHIHRAHGAFTSAETYIAARFIFLILTLFQFATYRDGLVRFGLLVAMALMAFGIVLGQTRAPWIGAALAILIIFARDRAVRPLVVTGGVLASIAGLVLFFMMLNHLGEFIDRLTDMYTVANRLALWATALNMIAHNALFGIGFGADAFWIHKPEYITGIGDVSAQYAVDLGVPHNQYLHVASLLGIVGLCGFLLIMFGVGRSLFRIQKDPSSTPMQARLAVYVGAIWSGLMFNSLFSDSYIQDYFWVTAYFLAGLVAGMRREPAPAPAPSDSSRPCPGADYGSPASSFR
jgi:O-antigen ligase